MRDDVIECDQKSREIKILMLEDCELDAELFAAHLAKAGLVFAIRRVANVSRFTRARIRLALGITAYFIVTSLVNPKVYEAAGLDPKQARAVAQANTHYHDKIRAGSAKTVEFLDSIGLIGGPSTVLLRRAHII